MKWFRILVVTLSLLVLLVMLVGCARSESIFPDENLEAAIRDALGKPVGEEITVDELANLITLSAEGSPITDLSDITDLSGLEYCTNLTKLGLGENQISDISVLAGLTNLESLGLGNNNISNISVLAGLTNLESLDLGNNNISDISVLAGLTNLESLDLWWNQISDLSALAGLTNLESLDLGDNNISDISALVANSGRWVGDIVWLQSNPLSTTSVDVYIPQLEQRGVTVTYE